MYNLRKRAAPEVPAKPKPNPKARRTSTKSKHTPSKATTNSALLDALKGTTVGSFPRNLVDDRVITVKAEDNLSEAYQTLADHHILAAPVVQPPQAPKGFIDTLDILAEVIKVASTFTTTSDSGLNAEELALFSEPILGALAIKQAAGCSGRDAWIPVKQTDSLFAVAEKLCDRDLHRVPVVDEKDNLVSLITESDICKFLMDKTKLLGKTGKAKIRDVVPAKRKALCVQKDAMTLHAFKKMCEERVSFLVVLDGDGRVVEAISASDLRPWNQFVIQDIPLRFTDLSGLAIPVSTFLEKVRSEARPPRRRVLTCTADSSVNDVLDTLVHHRVHHLCIVDDKTRKPTGVVSLRDIIQHCIA